MKAATFLPALTTTDPMEIIMAGFDTITENMPIGGEALLLLAQLRFTATHSDGRIDFWRPEANDGDWAAQCQQGREYAAEMVEYVAGSGNGAALPAIVRRIAERSEFGGVEAGFFTALSMRLS